MSEAQVAAAPVTSEHSDDAVRARFRESIKSLPEDQRGNIILNEPDPEVKEKKVEKSEKVENKDDIPSEFFDNPEKVQVDEWEKITNEQQKGHIKSSDWDNYKKLAKAKIEAKEKELAELRTKIPKDDYVPEKLGKELESLRKSVKERDELISRKYVEESPQFKEKFVNRQSSVDKQIAKLGKDLNLEDDQVHAILNASMKRRMDLIGEIEGPGGQASMAALLLERDRIQDERTQFLEDHQKDTSLWQQEEEQRANSEKIKAKEFEDKEFASVLEEMSKEYAPFSKVEGREEWNKSIEEDVEYARKIMQGDFTAREWAQNALNAASAKRIYRMFEAARGRAISAEKELAELKAAGPTASQAQNGDAGDPTKGMTPDERARYSFHQAVAASNNNGFRR